MTTATSPDELQQQIRDRYDSLSKRLQQVFRYMLDDASGVVFDTVAVIAEHAGVPPSTLVRSTSAFDSTGFSEIEQLFRMNLAEETTSCSGHTHMFREVGNEVVPETPLDILQEFVRSDTQALQQLAVCAEPEVLERAVRLSAEADTIHVTGLHHSFSVAAYLTHTLSHPECRPILSDGVGEMLREQINHIKVHDIVVSIDFSPYAKEALVVSEVVANIGARWVVIIDSQISPLATFSDLCPMAKKVQVDVFRSQSAALCLIQSLVVTLAYHLSDGSNENGHPVG